MRELSRERSREAREGVLLRIFWTLGSENAMASSLVVSTQTWSEDCMVAVSVSWCVQVKCTVKPPIMDTQKEDKPPNRGQAEITRVYYTLYRKSPLKEDNLSTKDKMAGPEGVLINKRYTVEPLIKATPDVRTPLHKGHFNETQS